MIPVFGDENKTSGLSIKTNFFSEQTFSSENILVHVLQGEVKVTVADKKTNLTMNEMMMIRGNEHVKIDSQKQETYLLVYTISNHCLNRYVDMTSNTIETTLINHSSNDLKKLGRTSKAILQGLRQNNGKMNFHLRGLASELLHIITKDLLVKRKIQRNADSRILEALLYIETNYRNVMGLEDIANYFDVTPAYFSRYFKAHTGSSFIEYLTDHRLEKAAYDISHSAEKISVIASQTGFTNMNSFNKKFRMKFGYTPRMYRKKYEHLDSVENASAEIAKIQQLPATILQDANKTKFDLSNKNHFTANNYPWKKIINIGSAEDLLQSDLRNHIKLLKKNLDISYIRFWNIFTKGMNIDPTVTVNYNFEKIDSILDFLLAEGIKPLIELRYKVRRIHRSTKKALIFENEDFKFSLNSPEWFDMVEKFMKHVNKRYGKKIVNEWMLEFSFEHYQGKDDLKELITHYKKTYEIIKKQNSILKIGGPGAPAQNQNRNGYSYRKDLLYFQKEQVDFDFISYTLFPYLVGTDGEKNSQRVEREDFLLDTVVDINKTVAGSDYHGAEIIITEWNNTISNRNAINDSLFKGSYLIKNFSSIIDKVDGIAYWVGSDLFSEFMDSRDILHGGAGLLAKGSLMKPAFHAYRFMDFLNDKIILNIDGIIASYNEETEEYSLITYNYQGPNLTYYLTAEDEVRVDNIHRFFDDTEIKEVQISFSLEPSKKFESRTFRVNNESGNIISGWKDIDFRSSLRNKDLEYLHLKAAPQIKFSQLSSDINGKLLIEENLAPNEFVYISISPIDE